MIGWRGHSFGTSFAIVLALAGCGIAPPTEDGLTESPPPEGRPMVPEPSQSSRDLAAYYTRYEQQQRTKGLLRTDGGGIDTPYSTRDLTENFERIALFDEYALRAGRYVPQQSASRLRRWDVPVRVEVVFGKSVDPEQRDTDRDNISKYVARLARVTGRDIRMATPGTSGNYFVLIQNLDEQRMSRQLLERLVPGIDDTTVRDITDMQRFTFCSVYAFSTNQKPDTYTTAVAVIRSEHPPLLRLSCIHEEIAQGLGLANDSPAARPSIFNDDDEFALLTSHDEKLLRILYDRRLLPGLEPGEARPLVQEIASELMGGSS
jgi:hypothetical protein